MNERLLQKTRSHYDANPFIQGGVNRIAWWRDYLEDFLPDELIRDRLVADIGSSVGEISRGLLDRGARVACLDLSARSLTECRRLNPEAEVLHGNALQLPLADESFDHAISIGVLHHTPDCRAGFDELARITAPGGSIVIFLYNYWNIYNVIYQAFAPVRSLIPLERVPAWMVRTLQPFARTHLGQKLDLEQLRNLLGDKLWTPRATFHSVRQVRRWGDAEGLDFVKAKKFYLGYANVMLFRKRGEARATPRSEIVLRCTECGESPMRRGEGGHVCPNCETSYEIREGIIRCLTDEGN